MAEPTAFRHSLRVRYSECDAQGIVFNAHYLAYADHLLTELWRAAIGGYGVMLERGADAVVAEANVRFRAPARFDDELDCAVTVTHLGTTSMTVLTRLHRSADDDTLLAEIRARHVWIDPATHTKMAMPGWARDALAPYTVIEAVPAAAPSA